VLRFGWGVPAEPPPNHAWDWPEKPVIDEVKHANANKTNLSTGIAGLRRIYAQQGLDYEEELPRMAEDYGVTVDEMKAALFQIHFGGGASAKEPDEDEDDKPTPPPARGRNRLATVGRNGNGNGNGNGRF